MPTPAARTNAALIAALPTPCALIEAARLDANLARLRAGLPPGVALRLHVKTTKSPELARRAFGGGTGPIAVSTLAEAEAFAEAGFRDILYAVGLAPQKLPRLKALAERHGFAPKLLVDAPDAARALAGSGLPALVEIDVDGHRGGLRPPDPVLPQVARLLADGGTPPAGVLAHAGESYALSTPAALAAAAEAERKGAVAAAEVLRRHGHAAPMVSIGSTPTSHALKDGTGVTEIRAGVFALFDLFMAGVGVCTAEDIALSVLCTVIGHQPDKGWVLTDAGWMALSRDRGTARQAVDQLYGTVCRDDLTPIPGLLVADTSQEHGILRMRDGSPPPDLPIGMRLRILPNHACATCAQHDAYHILFPDAPPALWQRVRGW